MKIRIANRRAGSAKYTTARQAQRYVSLGQAVLIGATLHFLAEAEQLHMRNIERQLAGERHCSDVYVDRLSAVWWDGDDPGGMHRPGEVVS